MCFSPFLFHPGIEENAPDCQPPSISEGGADLPKKKGQTQQPPGSHSLRQIQRKGTRNFRHQLKMLCPQKGGADAEKQAHNHGPLTRSR